MTDIYLVPQVPFSASNGLLRYKRYRGKNKIVTERITEDHNICVAIRPRPAPWSARVMAPLVGSASRRRCVSRGARRRVFSLCLVLRST